MDKKFNGFWQCEFLDQDGKSIWRMINAKTTTLAFKNTFEMGLRFKLDPQFETLRYATDEEVKAFKKMIRQRVKEKNAATK